jgi:hypothetical protein
MSSVSTRFDLGYKVEMNWYAVGRHQSGELKFFQGTLKCYIGCIRNKQSLQSNNCGYPKAERDISTLDMSTLKK